MGNRITVDRQGLGRSLNQWGDVYGTSYQLRKAGLRIGEIGLERVQPLAAGDCVKVNLFFVGARVDGGKHRPTGFLPEGRGLVDPRLGRKAGRGRGEHEREKPRPDW